MPSIFSLRPILLVLALSGCLPILQMPPNGQNPDTMYSDADAKIIVYGDSMMAWNNLSGNSTPAILSRMLNQPIRNKSVIAAHVSNAVVPFLDIRKQRDSKAWPVTIVNGGANDFIFECICMFCSGVLSRLASPDGQEGELPDFLRQLRDSGSEVIYVGYHRPRNMFTPVRHCGDEINELEARIEAFSASETGITFVSLADAIPPGRTDLYAPDRVHPSAKGSEALAMVLETEVRFALQRTELNKVQGNL